MNRQYAYSRNFENETAVITVNNDDSSYVMTVPAGNADTYIGILSGEKVAQVNGNIVVNIPACSGDIWISEAEYNRLTDDKENMIIPVLKEETKTDDIENTPQATECDVTKDEPQTEIDNVSCEQVTETDTSTDEQTPETPSASEPTDDNHSDIVNDSDAEAAYAKGVIAGLQEAIIARMEKNGYVTDQMKQDVRNNTHHDSLINWIKSF